MKISEFVKALLDEQGKYGDITIQVEYDGMFHAPRIKGVETSLTSWPMENNFEPVHTPTAPRLIIK